MLYRPRLSCNPQTVCVGSHPSIDLRPREKHLLSDPIAVLECLFSQAPEVVYCLPSDSRAEEGGKGLLTDPRLGVAVAETMPQTLESSYRQTLDESFANTRALRSNALSHRPTSDLEDSCLNRSRQMPAPQTPHPGHCLSIGHLGGLLAR